LGTCSENFGCTILVHVEHGRIRVVRYLFGTHHVIGSNGEINLLIRSFGFDKVDLPRILRSLWKCPIKTLLSNPRTIH